jgi:hypothetical protein
VAKADVSDLPRRDAVCLGAGNLILSLRLAATDHASRRLLPVKIIGSMELTKGITSN